MHAYLAEHPRWKDSAASLFPGRSREHETFKPAMDWGHPWDAESFYSYHCKRALKATGLIGVSFHNLRLTYSSWLARAGQRPEVVAKLLGDRDATITLPVYTTCGPRTSAMP